MKKVYIFGTSSPKIKVTNIEYHRNGVGGVGFYVILFEEGDSKMVATVFPLDSGDFFNGQEWNGMVSVFDVGLLAQDEIKFGYNSFRGDNYESLLRQAIKDRQEVEG